MNATEAANVKGFAGKLVRLVAFDPEKDTEAIVRWNHNSEYQQLLDSGPARVYSPGNMKDWWEKHAADLYGFGIYTLEDHRLIGQVDLSGVDWVARNCWVGIGIGEPELWGKGYGSDAMNEILRFGFTWLNLNRVSLTVFKYNERGYRSYLKCGFKEEGRLRQWMQRGGERFDLIYMGILREEWIALQERTRQEVVGS